MRHIVSLLHPLKLQEGASVYILKFLRCVMGSYWFLRWVYQPESSKRIDSLLFFITPWYHSEGTGGLLVWAIIFLGTCDLFHWTYTNSHKTHTCTKTLSLKQTTYLLYSLALSCLTFHIFQHETTLNRYNSHDLNNLARQNHTWS